MSQSTKDPGRKPVALHDLVAHCNHRLQPESIEDYKGAVNGLQVENDGGVTRLGAAVDASLSIIRQAVLQEVDLLIVHHGLFWTPRVPWTGATLTMARTLLQNNIAVYSSHLPLDIHPEIGNNALLFKALDLGKPIPFFKTRGIDLGIYGDTEISGDQLEDRLGSALGRAPHVIRFGPEISRRVAVITGGAGSEMAALAAEGVDTFITGEGPHWTYALAQELRLNVYYGGHYATETFGVRALAAELSEKFGIPWTFLDDPSGL